MDARRETTFSRVVSVADEGRPAPARGKEATMRAIVHAAGVDRGVWHLMTGQAYLIRVAGYGFRRPKNPVRGREVAGRVEAVGKTVTRFRQGDAVMGVGEGTFAEYARAREDKLVPKPAAARSSARSRTCSRWSWTATGSERTPYWVTPRARASTR